MRKIEGKIEIFQPVDDVFDFVADETNEPRYNEDMARCEKVTSGPIGVGTRFEAEMKSTGGTPMTVEVTGYQRPHRLESRAQIEGVMDVRGGVKFEAIPGGTLISWNWDVEPHGCMRLLGPFITRMGGRNEERIWRSLKTLLETPKDAVASV
jgi:Polyketide cyclase / dehydrase and lipid transport